MGLSLDALAQPQHWSLYSRHLMQPRVGLGEIATGPPPSPSWAGEGVQPGHTLEHAGMLPCGHHIE